MRMKWKAFAICEEINESLAYEKFTFAVLMIPNEGFRANMWDADVIRGLVDKAIYSSTLEHLQKFYSSKPSSNTSNFN